MNARNGKESSAKLQIGVALLKIKHTNLPERELNITLQPATERIEHRTEHIWYRGAWFRVRQIAIIFLNAMRPRA